METQFKQILVDGLTAQSASENLIAAANKYSAEWTQDLNVWLQGFLQFLTLGAKETTTLEDAELAALVVENISIASTQPDVDPVENAEVPTEVETPVDPIENAEVPTSQPSEEPATDPVENAALEPASEENE